MHSTVLSSEMTRMGLSGEGSKQCKKEQMERDNRDWIKNTVRVDDLTSAQASTEVTGAQLSKDPGTLSQQEELAGTKVMMLEAA